MDFLQVDGKEIPLLEAPQKLMKPRRGVFFYVLFKQKTLICDCFWRSVCRRFIYLLLKPVEYTGDRKVFSKTKLVSFSTFRRVTRLQESA